MLALHPHLVDVPEPHCPVLCFHLETLFNITRVNTTVIIITIISLNLFWCVYLFFYYYVCEDCCSCTCRFYHVHCHEAVSDTHKKSYIFKYFNVPDVQACGDSGKENSLRGQKEETLKGTGRKRDPILIWVTLDLCFMWSKNIIV